MANYWPGVQSDILTAMTTAWPEIGANFEVVIARKVNWYNLFKDKNLSNNYAVFQFVSIVEEDWAMDALTYAAMMTLYYIELDTTTGVVLDLFGKMKLMQDYLVSLNTVFQQIQVMTEGMSIEVGEGEAAGVMSASNMPITVASISFKCLFGELI